MPWVTETWAHQIASQIAAMQHSIVTLEGQISTLSQQVTTLLAQSQTVAQLDQATQRAQHDAEVLQDLAKQP